jgi:hypothetical protein
MTVPNIRYTAKVDIKGIAKTRTCREKLIQIAQ